MYVCKRGISECVLYLHLLCSFRQWIVQERAVSLEQQHWESDIFFTSPPKCTIENQLGLCCAYVLHRNRWREWERSPVSLSLDIYTHRYRNDHSSAPSVCRVYLCPHLCDLCCQEKASVTKMSINTFPKSRSLVSPTSSRSVRHMKHLLWIHGWWQYSGKTLSWYWSFQLHLDKLERRGEKLISAQGHVWMFNHPLAWSGYKMRYLRFEMINEQSFISAASLALTIINKVRQFQYSSQLKLRLIWDAFFQNHQLLQSRFVWMFSARR